MTSNDTSLDELQEIVNFIKQNKNDLDSLGVANIAGLQSALDAKQESLVSGNNIKTLNGNPILGSGDIVITADVSRMDIEVTSFASLSYTGPTGVTVSKEYSNSSLRIIHGQGKKPSNWAVYNNEANPITQVVSSSTRNLQVVDDNTVIVTNVSEFEVMSIVLNF